MPCPACGHPVEPEAELCLECGEVLTGSPRVMPPSPEAQLQQRVIASRPELVPSVQRGDSSPSIHLGDPRDRRDPGDLRDLRRPPSAPAIVWRAQPAVAPRDVPPLVGPAAIQKPRRRPSDEDIRCQGCGVMSPADAARCRSCGERFVKR